MNSVPDFAERRTPLLRWRSLAVAALIAAFVLAAEALCQLGFDGDPGGVILVVAVGCGLILLPLMVAGASGPWATNKQSVLRLVVVVLAMIAGCALAEVCANWYFTQAHIGFENTRLYLAGRPPYGQPFLPQAYLLYTARPGMFGTNYHNRQGYRGPEVPMQRTPGVARIVCLGGSTTYGWSVADPLHAFPAQLADILQQQLPEGVRGVEVINAGLPWATTAAAVSSQDVSIPIISSSSITFSRILSLLIPAATMRCFRMLEAILRPCGTISPITATSENRLSCPSRFRCWAA